MLPRPARPALRPALRPAWHPALALLFACAPCWSQSAPPAAAASAPRVVVEASADERGEPNVRRSVIEDEGSKIDELRVRGQVQRVVVTPKVGGATPYEIVVGRGGRTPVEGTGGTSGALGKRVWNLLAF